MSTAHQPGKSAAPLVSERREEILGLAARIFADKGYASTTVREIADFYLELLLDGLVAGSSS